MKIASIGPSATLTAFEWNEWLYQLASALISGGAGALASAGVSPMIDSQHFNPTTWDYYKLIIGMFFGTGILKMCIYLQAHPLPQVKVTTTTTVETTKKQDKPKATVVTTVEKVETKVEPVPEAKS